MGTGKIGRYLNTKGSSRTVSEFALVHSSEGRYTQPSKKGDKLRLASGGHGQVGLEQLKKYKIDYNIVHTYPNGVRVGNLPDHRNKLKCSGSNQSWFPAHWSVEDIRRAGEHVAGLKANRHAPSGKKLYGVWKGVLTVVVKTNGKIASIFPDSDQRAVLRRRKKK